MSLKMTQLQVSGPREPRAQGAEGQAGALRARPPGEAVRKNWAGQLSVSANSQHAERRGEVEGQVGETLATGGELSKRAALCSVWGHGTREALSQELDANPDFTSGGSQVFPTRQERRSDEGVSGHKELPALPRAHSWSGENWGGWGNPRDTGNLSRQAQTMCLGSRTSWVLMNCPSPGGLGH